MDQAWGRRGQHPEAVVRQQLDPRGPRIGEQPAMVRLGAAHRVDHHRRVGSADATEPPGTARSSSALLER